MEGAMGGKILVVDRNKAFSMMLRDMLETQGGYQVHTAQRGSEGLDHLRKADYDLTIVDVDLDPEDMAYDELIPRIRELHSTMRLMLIPLMGETLPADAQRFDIQGTLSKPFFVDDLLPSIRDALSREVTQPATPPPSPPPRAGARRAAEAGSDAGVREVLADLAHETQADAVLLVSYPDQACHVVAHAGTLGEDQADTLALLSVDAIQAASAAAHLLGRSDAPFEHNMFENDLLRLYVMTLPADHLLIVVTPTTTPLGTIRHNLRRARRHLAATTLT